MDNDRALEITKVARAIMANEYAQGRKPNLHGTIWQAMGNYKNKDSQARVEMFRAVAKLVRGPRQLSLKFPPPRR